MGCCTSCLGGDDDGPSPAETEMQAKNAEAEKKSLAIARGMSAPSIEVKERTKASGYGLVLAAVAIEQDAAYWEVHVGKTSEGSVEVKTGLATKKDRKFYQALEEQDHDNAESNGTSLMGKMMVSDSDVIGVVAQQSDLPMIQFFVNGEALYDQSITRFRGTVYPSMFLPQENEGLTLQFVFKESEFKQMSPSSRISPVIVARGLV